MESSKICDKILRKFEGNKLFTWDQIHEKDFYEDIDSDYFIVENHINFLIGDGCLQEIFSMNALSLSRKGWFVMTNPGVAGYETKKANEDRKERREKQTLNWAKWATVLAALSIIAWLIDKFTASK